MDVHSLEFSGFRSLDLMVKSAEYVMSQFPSEIRIAYGEWIVSYDASCI